MTVVIAVENPDHKNTHTHTVSGVSGDKTAEQE